MCFGGYDPQIITNGSDAVFSLSDPLRDHSVYYALSLEIESLFLETVVNRNTLKSLKGSEKGKFERLQFNWETPSAEEDHEMGSKTQQHRAAA